MIEALGHPPLSLEANSEAMLSQNEAVQGSSLKKAARNVAALTIRLPFEQIIPKHMLVKLDLAFDLTQSDLMCKPKDLKQQHLLWPS